MSRRVRVRLLLVAAVVAVLSLGWISARLTREPSGPPSSTFATSRAGAAAYADLLAEFGHPVRRLRTGLADSNLGPDGTVILLDAGSVSGDDRAAALRFLEGGGRLIVAGAPPPGLVGLLLPDPPSWSPEGPVLLRAVADDPEVDAIRTVRTRGEGVFESVGSTKPLLAGDEGAAAVIAPVGKGRLVLVADASPFQNRLLGHADNAAFAVAVAGGADRPVSFAENVHGYGEAIGLAALPRRWWWALGGVVLAALVLMWARGARLGPAESVERELPPPRRAYVEALGASLARTKQPAGVVQPLIDRAQRHGSAEFSHQKGPVNTAEDAERLGQAFARLVKTRGGRL